MSAVSGGVARLHPYPVLSGGLVCLRPYPVVPCGLVCLRLYPMLGQAEVLDLNKTVLQTVEEAAEGWKMNDIKALLGRCNFKGDTVHRKVSFLSGGEKVSRIVQESGVAFRLQFTFFSSN